MKTTIKELLTRGVDEVIIKKHLEKRLKAGEKLRIKFGIDPTSPDIHLGHTIPLRKLKQFQVLGHKVILIIGDFTATIGDPSARIEARRPLTFQQVKSNMKKYLAQIEKIVDLKKAEIRYNSEWLTKKKSLLYELASKISIQRALERDDFQKRLKENREITILEVLYPLLQGYDSVAVRADLEIGGTDQKFNLLMGRKIQKRYNQKEQDIMTLSLLIGTDGVRKMSKSFGNYVGILEPANEIYGKIMSIPDNFIVEYFILLTKIPDKELDKIKKDFRETRVNPKDLKARLAREIVAMYHSKKVALEAEKEFKRIFKEKGKPSKVKSYKLRVKRWKLPDLLLRLKLVSSKSKARQLIEQRGVKIDDKVIKDWKKKIQVKNGTIVQVGKRKFAQVKIIK